VLNRLYRLMCVVMPLCPTMTAHADDSKGFGFDDAPANVSALPEPARGTPYTYRWIAKEDGSVRLVGYVRNLTPEAEGTFQVRVGNEEVYQCAFGKQRLAQHVFDIGAYELDRGSTVELVASAGPGSKRVRLECAMHASCSGALCLTLAQ